LSESLCPSLCFAKNITARLLHLFVCCSVHFIKINRYFVFSYSVFNVLFAWAKNLPSSRKVNHSPPTFLPLLPRRFKSYHQDFLLSSVILSSVFCFGFPNAMPVFSGFSRFLQPAANCHSSNLFQTYFFFKWVSFVFLTKKLPSNRIKPFGLNNPLQLIF